MNRSPPLLLPRVNATCPPASTTDDWKRVVHDARPTPTCVRRRAKGRHVRNASATPERQPHGIPDHKVVSTDRPRRAIAGHRDRPPGASCWCKQVTITRLGSVPAAAARTSRQRSWASLRISHQSTATHKSVYPAEQNEPACLERISDTAARAGKIPPSAGDQLVRSHRLETMPSETVYRWQTPRDARPLPWRQELRPRAASGMVR